MTAVSSHTRTLAVHADALERVALVATSPSMRQVLDTAERLATTTTPALLRGETGVGKGRVAAYIHERGPRASGPFLEINCAAIPHGLFEAELFGHERGAFTDATCRRRGRFELASGGTLLLDELGELPLALQAKLLQVLQTRRVEPVGSERSIPVDVRLLAATNRDLRAEVEAGRFRRDLFHRVAVVELEIPPLRARIDDLPELIRAFTSLLAPGFAGRVDEPAMAALVRYPWPGNVRELANVLERATLLCDGDVITLDDLPRTLVARDERPAHARDDHADRSTLPNSWSRRPWKQVRRMIVHEGERAYLSAMLQRHGGKIGVTAEHAGISPRSLFEKMRRHGLRKEDFRTGRA